MTLLIADDDEQIRLGMELGIDWVALDIHQVITASNGIEALERFCEFLPDIVVTDIRMPGMDGLELLKKIKEIRPETKVIILSAYNEFEYLKKAIQLDAVDYEVKPIRAASLIALIQKLKDEILRENVTSQEFQKYLESYKVKFEEDVLSGSITDILVIQEGLRKCYSFDATGTLICIAIQIDFRWTGKNENTELAMDMVSKLFLSYSGSQGVCLRSKDMKLVFLLKPDYQYFLSYKKFINELFEKLQKWNHEILLSYSVSFSAGISNPGNISEFTRLMNEAHQALSMRIYDGNGTIHVYDRSIVLNDKIIIGLLGNKEFISKISWEEFDSAILMVNNEFDCLKGKREYGLKSISDYSRRLLQIFMVSFKNAPIDFTEFVQSRIDLIDRKHKYMLMDDFQEIIVSLLENAKSRFSRKMSPAMQRVNEFIRENYTRDLTVEMLAEYIEKSPNYFSHLFKQEFGISFKEFITQLRIEKAKELIMSTNDLFCEISEKVGFSDYTYFSHVFKKIEGYPPVALRRKISEDVDE